MRSCTFHVSLPGTGRVWRKIEMRADQTLEDLHFAIQEAYGWDTDHLYSFFMSGKAWDRRTEYCLSDDYDPWEASLYFEEEGQEEEEEETDLTSEEFKQHVRALFGSEGMTEEMQANLDTFLDEFIAMAAGPGNVQTTTLAELNLRPKQEFMYLFDYGDGWRFKVRVHAINDNADPHVEYPRLVESVGKAPPQYLSWDEDEDW